MAAGVAEVTQHLLGQKHLGGKSSSVKSLGMTKQHPQDQRSMSQYIRHRVAVNGQEVMQGGEALV